MTGRGSRPAAKRGFATRPGDAGICIKAPVSLAARDPGAHANTARLTIDVISEPRGWIKIASSRRSVMVAEMLRDLPPRSFPEDEGVPP